MTSFKGVGLVEEVIVKIDRPDLFRFIVCYFFLWGHLKEQA